jgi:hypothetical protein
LPNFGIESKAHKSLLRSTFSDISVKKNRCGSNERRLSWLHFGVAIGLIVAADFLRQRNMRFRFGSSGLVSAIRRALR